MTTETALARQDPADILAAINRANLAGSTKKKYSAMVTRYLDTGGDPYNAAQLAAFAQGLPASGRAFLKAAVHLYTDKLALDIKAMARPEKVDAVQANLYRIEALQEAIKAPHPKGIKAHTWLNQKQVKALLNTCDDSLTGQRDRIALGLLVAAGLRREEAAALTFDGTKLQPVGDKMRTVLAVKGKGAKNRVVPISDRLANAIDEWGKQIYHQGRILRSIVRSGQLRNSLSTVGIFHIVQRHGAQIGNPELSPHDLRRTYAQLGYEAGVLITQISKLLGHTSVTTTQRYLNLDLDLETTVSDFIPL